MRRYSPYNYGFGNPLRFIDKDGMGPIDVILGGVDKQKAFKELQASVKGQLDLSMDDGGKVGYTTISGVTPSVDATQLTTAINDHSVTVNVDATNDRTKAVLGDEFDGNTVKPSTNGDTKTVDARQKVNPEITKEEDDYYGKSEQTRYMQLLRVIKAQKYHKSRVFLLNLLLWVPMGKYIILPIQQRMIPPHRSLERYMEVMLILKGINFLVVKVQFTFPFLSISQVVKQKKSIQFLIINQI